MSKIHLYCPYKKNGTVDILICIYKCPKSKLLKCPEYAKIYPTLLSFTIEDKYLEKYGHPTLLVPNSLKKRRKRNVPVVTADVS